jgi:hypothetical protein
LFPWNFAIDRECLGPSWPRWPLWSRRAFHTSLFFCVAFAAASVVVVFVVAVSAVAGVGAFALGPNGRERGRGSISRGRGFGVRAFILVWASGRRAVVLTLCAFARRCTGRFPSCFSQKSGMSGSSSAARPSRVVFGVNKTPVARHSVSRTVLVLVLLTKWQHGPALLDLARCWDRGFCGGSCDCT